MSLIDTVMGNLGYLDSVTQLHQRGMQRLFEEGETVDSKPCNSWLKKEENSNTSM